jgi:hypothetical protein
MVKPAQPTVLPTVRIFRRLDRPLYILWAAVSTLSSARMFYGYMLKQTEGEWSAPLDDVFIHFDYARATALGHPFEWTVGNGYSSGNTSLTYPFVLAAGWLAGFTDRDLMKWAAMVAMVCVFGTLLAARRLFIENDDDDWGRLSAYLLPPIFLGVGALDWSLWSGMEVSFFLATWAIALVAWLRLERTGKPKDAWLLGLAGALMVTTRPEAAFTIAIFGFAAAHRHRRRRPLALLTGVAALPLLLLFAQAVANKALTGEWSANGAIVKLALNNPYMTGEDKFKDWFGNAQYASLRNLDYHFADIRGEISGDLVPDAWPAWNPVVYLCRTWWWAGVIPLAVATLPLIFPRTRRIALVLWGQVIAWIGLVALNGQVRWQNERYVMPAVAWLLVLAALGVAVACRVYAKPKGYGRLLKPGIVWSFVAGTLIVQTVGVLTRPPGPPHFRLAWTFSIAVGGALFLLFLWWRPLRIALLGMLLVLAYDHQIPKMRDQKFFFGRASRNIRDQHLAIGRYLKELQPSRVLVGDAGAILYESDRPGLDIIGLGGFNGMPFARAGVHGLASTLELLENVPARERPDVLAIFPTWWGPIPSWFTSEELRRFPVEGNVICGGYEQNVYKADWHLLGTGQFPRFDLPKGEKLRAEIDVADLSSEQANGYKFDRPNNGWTEMRVLSDPAERQKDLFDGGRRIALDRSESFDVHGLVLGRVARLIVRVAQENKTRVRVRIDGQDAGAIDLDTSGGWADVPFTLRAEQVRGAMRISLTNEGPGDFVDYHVWITQ